MNATLSLRERRLHNGKEFPPRGECGPPHLAPGRKLRITQETLRTGDGIHATPYITNLSPHSIGMRAVSRVAPGMLFWTINALLASLCATETHTLPNPAKDVKIYVGDDSV